MLQIILIIIAVGLLFSLLKWVGGILIKCLRVIAIIIGIYIYISFFQITLPLTLLYITYLIIKEIIQAIKTSRKRKQVREWVKTNTVSYSENQIDDIIHPLIEQIESRDQNEFNHIFSGNNLPYGRINAFLNYYKKDIYGEEPYYYSTTPSQIDNELREYGIAITRNGIYITRQWKNDSGTFQNVTQSIQFSGLYSVTQNGTNRLAVKNIDKTTFDMYQKDIIIPAEMVQADDLKKLCDKVISTKINVAMLTHNIVEQVNNTAEERLNKEQVDRIIELAGLGGVSGSVQAMQNETKNLMNTRQGGGYAAEYANTTIDRLKGNKVENTAQVLDEHGRQVKAGADRTLNGLEIQTKYYKTASESIGAAFNNESAIYITSDGTGRMMQIEVPRDQYSDALKFMQDRIDSGQVPGVRPGENAGDYVRKGYYTYAQAWNVARTGTIESLTVDLISGSVCSSMAGGISAAIVFATAIWNGVDVETAAKMGLETGIKILGKGALIYTLTMQLSRAELANPFIEKYTVGGILQGQMGVANPIFVLSEQLSSQIRTSAMANTNIGNILGLNIMNGKMLIGNTVMSAVVFGPDLCNAVQGKISFSQLVKNSAIGVSSLAAASIGQTLIPIPVVGGLIGAGIGGMVAKSVLDNFIEDDAKKMFRILKEEFLDVVMMSQLLPEELNEVTEHTIGNKELIKMLQKMHASRDQRLYARNVIVDAAVVKVFSKRQKITLEINQTGMKKLLEKIA